MVLPTAKGRSDKKRRLSWEMAGALVTTVVWVVCLILLSRVTSQSIYLDGSKEILTLDRSGDAPFFAGLCFGVVTLIFALIGLARRRKWIFVLPIVAALCVNPFCLLGIIFTSGGDYTDAATVVGRDHTEYHFMTSSFLQGASLVIAKKIGSKGAVTKYEILSKSSWEAMFGYMLVVRPKQANKEPNLYQAVNGELIGVPEGNDGFVAYDPKSKTGRSDKDLKEVSPFCLLGPNDEPRQDDFQNLLKLDPDCRPSEAVVETELKNPNSNVREMAAKLLKRMKVNPEKKNGMI